MMGAGVGQPVPEEYIPLLLEEMRFGEEDTRAVRWHADPARPAAGRLQGDHHRRRLRRALRRDPAAGSSGSRSRCWRRTPMSAAPGWRTSIRAARWTRRTTSTPTPSTSTTDWTRHFSRRDEILAYIERCDPYLRPAAGISGSGSRSPRAVFDEATGGLAGRPARRRRPGGDGPRATRVISAVGQLNRPAIPRIAGLDDFQRAAVPHRALGPQRRSARASGSP